MIYLIYCNTPKHAYIGETTDFKSRIAKHLLRQGANFTKRHGVFFAMKVQDYTEKEFCLVFKAIHPDWVVCGGPWTTNKGVPTQPGL